MKSEAIVLAGVLVTAGCGAADARTPRAPVESAKAETEAVPSELATTILEPAGMSQSFAADEIDYQFSDPDRTKKLSSSFAAIDAMAEDVVRRSRIPGVALGIVVDDHLAHHKGFGVSDLTAKTEPDLDTAYRIASITKSFTALAVLSLRDDGAITLDDPLSRWVPEASRLVYPTRDAPPITLRHLLNHTSGLPRAVALEPRNDPSEEDLARALIDLPLVNAPGTHWSYSNLGYSVLGLAAARAAHTSLRTLVTRRILAPLGMTSTVWDAASVPSGKLAMPYERQAGGDPQPVPSPTLGAAEGSGGEYSTVRDMARYLAFQLAAYPPRGAAEAGPVRRSSVRETHFSALQSGMYVGMREDAKKGDALVQVVSQRYGFGWTVEQSCEFDEVVWHNGHIEGYVSKAGFLPDYGVGVVALVNVSGRDAGQADYIADQMLHLLKQSGGLLKRSPKLSAAFDPTMKQFLAVYNEWDDTSYKAMLRRGRNDAPEEKLELSGYKQLHGACRGYSVQEVLTPFSARLKMDCERGSLQMRVGLWPEDGKLDGFVGTSRDVVAPATMRKMADRLAALIGKWDPRAYNQHLAKLQPLAETTKFFGSLRAAHRSCVVESTLHEGFDWKMQLACDRGGDMSLTLTLDAKDPNRVTGYRFDGAGERGLCPMR